jgi:ABC-type thiamin/hydroxymethylpyrimidine transport system permease subunit
MEGSLIDGEKRRGTMKNPVLFIGAIVLGVIALIIGILYQAQVLGLHPTRAIAGIVIGIILLIIGIAGMVIGRRGGPA